MANNIVGDAPNAIVAKATVSFLSAGITSDNTEIIYQVDGDLKSYKPGRAINGISGFTANKGYYLIAKQDMDLTSIVVPPVVTVPQLIAPATFTATPASSTQINLAWASSSNATGYVVDRATNSGFTTGVALGIYTGSGNSFNDTGRTTATTYYYRIRATAAGYVDSAYATANATTSSVISEETIVWNQLSNATTNSEGDLIASSSTVPAGGTATKKLNKANGAYVQYVVSADTAAAVLKLSPNNDADYTWNDAADMCAVYSNAGTVTFINGGAYDNEGASSLGQILRLEVSGNDVLLKSSTNGGSSFTTLDTATGVLASVTDIFIKGSMAAGAAGLMVNNAAGYNLLTI
jgi:hypothetical protein